MITPGPGSFATRGSILLTNRCNLRCLHCYTDAATVKIDELPTDRWKQIIDDLYAAGVLELFVGGGEPSIRPDYFEIMDYAISRGFVVMTSTNGSFLRPEDFSNVDPRVFMQVSLDGYRATHDWFRGPGSFDRALNTLEGLVRAGRTAFPGTVIHRHAIPELAQLYEAIRKTGARTWHVMRAQPSPRAQRRWTEVSITNTEWEHAVRALGELNREGALQINFNGVFDIREAAKIPEDDHFFFLPSEAGRDICIGPNGDLYATDVAFGRPEHRLGNAADEDLRAIWNRSRLTERFLEASEKITGPCRSCAAWHVCRGGSRVTTIAITGDPSAPDPFCPHAERALSTASQ